MTAEHKIVVSLEDVKAIIFECKHCRTRVTVLPDSASVPANCPHCPTVWLSRPGPKLENSLSPYLNFLQSLAAIRSHSATTGDEWPKFRILLEFDEAELCGRAIAKPSASSK
jgi:hypothetical protein